MPFPSPRPHTVGCGLDPQGLLRYWALTHIAPPAQAFAPEGSSGQQETSPFPSCLWATFSPLSPEGEEELSLEVSRAIGPQGIWVEGSEEPQRFARKSGKLPRPVARPAGPPPEAYWRRLAPASPARIPGESRKG